MIENFMKQLVKDLDLQLADLQTELPGVYAMVLGDNLTIFIKDTPQGFSMSSTLGPCPMERQEAFLLELLLADLFGQSTRRAILGLSDDGNKLTLSQVIDYNINYKEFNETLEDFINVADFWKTEALNYNKAA